MKYSKEKKYYYDAAAIAEPLAPTTAERYRRARSTNSKYTQEILPGLPEAYYPQTGSGAHEETACGGYAIRAKIALIYRA